MQEGWVGKGWMLDDKKDKAPSKKYALSFFV